MTGYKGKKPLRNVDREDSQRFKDAEDDLLKIPDHILLKLSRVELGKANAYIAELEEENKSLRKHERELEAILNDKEKRMINLLYSQGKDIDVFKNLINENQELKKELLELKSKYGALLQYHADKVGFNLKKAVNEWNAHEASAT